MKTKQPISLGIVLSLIYSLMLGSAVALFTNYEPAAVAIAFFIARFLVLFLAPPVQYMQGLLHAGVNKEIWIDKLKENFYAEFPWLDMVESWDEWVEFNTINFTVIGADPVILKNNVTWPIVAAQRTDTNSTITLDTYDSTTTRVRNVEEIESSTDKLASVTKQHRQALMQEIVTEGLWNYGPATAAAGAVACTGANRATVIGSQSTVASTMSLQDIASLQERWDALNLPQANRILMLNPYHQRDLIAQDISLQKEFNNLKTGQMLEFANFKIMKITNTPLYTKTSLAKKTYGAAVDNTNDCVASIAFIASEVGRAMGDVEAFIKPKAINPEQRADEVGFQVRMKTFAHRTTNFYQQALVSNRA